MTDPMRAFLKAHRTNILSSWADRTFAAYPPTSITLFRSKVSQFANPVGETIRSGLAQAYDGLVDGLGLDQIGERLDGIIRLRAVQDIEPGRALEFILSLRLCLPDTHSSPGQAELTGEDMTSFDRTVDALMLRAVTLYVLFREQVHTIRANEARARSDKLLERANKIIEQHATGQDIEMTDTDSRDWQGGERQ